MVVHTQTDRVQAGPERGRRVPARQPPARLPGLRQGRRVPAAGHHLRLGPRALALHRAQAPLREAARALAADRDRPRALHPLLPLRALLAGGRRGLPAGPRSSAAPHTFVGTFDGHPYVAPFSGNIVELCPVGALTSQPYRFRARPWDIEGAGSVCTLCPAQCNVELTVRDERVLRVLGRDNAEVDDGWLCDKGRFAYQAIHVDERIVEPLVRDGGELRRPRGSARRAPPRARSATRARPRRRARRRRHDQRGGLPAAARCCARASARRDIDSRARRRRCRSTSHRALARARRCRPRSPTSSSPTPCSCSTASRSTTRRSSTCASARACAATA